MNFSCTIFRRKASILHRIFAIHQWSQTVQYQKVQSLCHVGVPEWDARSVRILGDLRSLQHCLIGWTRVQYQISS